MEYNNYYQGQAGPPPPQPLGNGPPPNQQHPCSPQIQLMPPGPGASPMMHVSGPPPQQAMRQVVTPGLPPGHQQMQQGAGLPSQHIPPHHLHPQQQQQQPPQHLAQQQLPNYHQLPPHPPQPHSASPHNPQAHINHNMNLRPPSRPSTGPSPQQPHPMHQQSPHHISGPPPPPPPQQQQQHLGPGGPPLMPPSSQPSMQPHQHNHHQNFMGPGGSGPIPPPHQTSPHYSQPPPPLPPNNHHHHQGPPMPPHNHHPHHQPTPPQLPPMHHHHNPHQGPPPPSNYLPHHLPHQPIERGSPFYQNIPQTEFRIIELNKRLQNRPKSRVPASPLPLIESSEEVYWWKKFACDFFDEDSILTLHISVGEKPIEYTIGRTLIPRFFKSYFDGGVIDLSIKLRSTRETVHPHMITLECDQTDITTKNIFKHPNTNLPMNVVVHTEGHLSLEFVSNSFDTLLIKSWRFYLNQCHEYIDRSMTTTGLPNAILVDPVTKYGLTPTTLHYLKMCQIMEPMQDLMLQHRQTMMDPRSCLKHLLFDRYKLKSVEDNRVQPNKRRKRKTPATTGAGGGTKKSKANANNANALNNNNIGFNNINNSLMSPSTIGAGPGVPNLSLASQDVMVVGEPSMLGADFGDENERRITRLENNQFDASVNNSNNNVNQSQNQMLNSNHQSNQNQNVNHIAQSQQQSPHPQPQHLQQQPQSNYDTGNIQMMNHSSSNNSINSNSSSSNNNNNNSIINNNGTSDPNNSNTSDGNNCLQNNNNNNHLITMNGNVNHISHIVKSEMDIKQPSVPTPTAVDSEAR